MNKNASGFSLVIVGLSIVVIGLIGFVGFKIMGKHSKAPAFVQQSTANTVTRGNTDSQSNQQSGCTSMPKLQMPVDLAKVTSVLYPGQYRGNEYKAHGGFRFDNSKPNDISVKAPLDAQLYRASRYTQDGQIQILFEFNAACGYTYRLDHLYAVAPALQKIVDSLPAPTADSHSVGLTMQIAIKAGDNIATAVGFPASNNAFVDFGLYNTNQKNQASQDPAWAAKHQSNLSDQYGVCWFDMLPPADAAAIKSLPSGSSESGKTSDYCK